MNKKSGHWTNTGMAKFINDNLYNYKSDDEKSMNPFRWYRLQNGEDISKYRETINGFPCRLILINDGSTPLNEGQNEPTPGNTKDMGIFNFNHDKDATTTLGFDSDIFPNCASYEVTANSDTSAGAFMSYNYIDSKYYPSSDAPDDIYGGVTYTQKIGIDLFDTQSLTISDIIRPNGTQTGISGIELYDENRRWLTSLSSIWADNFTLDLTKYNAKYFTISMGWGKVKEFKINEKTFTCNFVEDIGDTYIDKEAWQTKELAYLKESFELRYPDEDDVAEDWGFMGIPMKYFDYTISRDSIITTLFKKPSKITVETQFLDTYNLSFYNENGIWFNSIYTAPANEEIDITSYNAAYISIGVKSTDEYIIIDGEKYFFKNKVETDTIKESYVSFDEGTGLKALIDWVDNCTDEEFVRDFEQHFHKDYTLRYFCLVTLIGAVDNLGKNMMLDTADNKIFFPRFYDIDTICSYDNSGQLKFDVDIEMEQGYWNTSSSRLWTRIRDLMHDDIVATYNDMRQNGVSYENMMHYIYDEQIAKIPQVYFNKDYDIKYAPFADSYIGMAHGDTYEHVKRWLKQRFTFVDTLFDYAPSYNNDVLTIRANTTELMTLEIETYTPVYQHVSWYNGQMDKKKIDGKVSVEFSGTAQAATDQEVLIYGGSNVKSIKGITSMNPNRMLIGSATKLVEIDAHDCPLLADINANKANLSPHEYLNKVNLSNCPLLEGNLRLNNSPLVQEINIKGTNITGMNLPSSIRNLQILRLPNTMTDLTLNDASMLHTLEFDEGTNLQSISMTNCNALENVIGLDLLQTPSITLNNSYNTAAELYFRDTTNLSLSNMSNLERVIFTPNNEYETFELINVANAPDYKVTTFNCPKLSTFMTTAPYRESYNDVSGYVDKEVEVLGDVILTENYSPKGVSFIYDNIFTDFENGGYIETEVDLSTCINYAENIISFGTGIDKWSGSTKQIHMHYNMQSGYMKVFDAINNNQNISVNIPATKIVVIRLDASGVYINGTKYCENSLIGLSSFSIGSQEGSVRSNALYNYIKYSDYVTEIIQAKDYGDIQPNTTFTANSIDISNTQFIDVKLLCTTDTNTLKLPTTVKNFYCDSSFDLDTDYLEDGEYDVVHGELVEQYTTDYEDEVVYIKENEVEVLLRDIDTVWKDGYSLNIDGNEYSNADRCVSDYIRVVPNTRFILSKDGITQYVNIGALVQYDINKQCITGGNWVNNVTLDTNCAYIRLDHTIVGRDEELLVITFTPYIEYHPNIIPSSADGSLIFSMYAPSNTVAPASGTWDLHGLEFDNFHTFGMNNDVIYTQIYNEVYHVGYYHNNSTGKSVNGYIPLYDTITDVEIYGFYSNGMTGQSLSFYDENKVKLATVNHKFIIADNKNGYGTLQIDITKYPTATMFRLESTDVQRTYWKIGNALYYFGKPDSSVALENWMTLPKLQSRELIYEGLTMPARYDDYNITIKNANISPKTHNTMLYPLLVNKENPITGTLDYTDYAGKHLSWSFAYTDEEYVNIIQPKEELINSYEYRYNAFYDTEYEFDNPYEIARYTSSASGVLPAFNAEFTYTYDEMNNGDGTYTTKIYADSLDNLPTSISFNGKTTLLTVDKLNTSKVTSMSYMFHNCNNLTSINVSEFDTSNVITMNQMFHRCNNLTSLDVRGFDTSNVTNMNQMFSGCSKLTSLDVSGFDTSNVTNMNQMFASCNALTSLDLSGFETGDVTDMNNMFNSCSSLTSLDLSNFDTSEVTRMDGMFNGCSALTSLNVSSFDTSKISVMVNMFYNCSSLTSLDLSNFDTTNVINMNNMFNGCTNLTSLNVSKFNTSKVTGMGGMFHGCSGLTSLDLSGFDTSNVSNMGTMFHGCSGLTSLDLSGFDISNVDYMPDIFKKCTNLISLNVINWSLDNVNMIIPLLPTSPSTSTLYASVIIDETKLPSGWVYKFDNVLEIARYTASASGVVPTFNNGFTGYNVNEIDNNNNTYTVSIMTDSLDNLPTSVSFSRKTDLLTVDKLNTSNVTTMVDMFRNCSKLTSLDVSDFNTAKVTDMSYMFYNCSSLTSLNLSSFDTTKVTDMSSMFYGCESLTSLDVSSFNTAKVTKMNCIFYGCSGLTTLGLSNFNTANVTSMVSMFYGCKSLTDLDLSGFDTTKVTSMKGMFESAKITNLTLDNWNVSKVSTMESMFNSLQSSTVSITNWTETTSLENMKRMFSHSYIDTLVGFENLNTSKVTNMMQLFWASDYSTLNFIKDWDTSSLTATYEIFRNCDIITSLDLSKWDWSLCNSSYNNSAQFMYCTELVYLKSPKNISCTLDLSYTKLDTDSLLDVINNLATVSTTQTLALGSTLLAKLTEEQIAIATNKGWTVS